MQHACPRIRNPFVQLGTSDSERTTATGKTGKSERPRPVEREVVKPDPSHNKVNHHSFSRHRHSTAPSFGPSFLPSFLPFAPLPPPSPPNLLPYPRLEIPVLSAPSLARSLSLSSRSITYLTQTAAGRFVTEGPREGRDRGSRAGAAASAMFARERENIVLTSDGRK